MSRSLHDLPRVEESLSFVYLERCRVEQDALAIAAWDFQGVTPIPVAALNVLLLGPGTVITHAAVRAITENGCSIVWIGEDGVRTYAATLGETRSARNLLRQAWLATREPLRLRVVGRMYRLRFREVLPPDLTLRQIRGKEGARVRDAYAEAARKAEVPWDGRLYDRDDWKSSTPVNRALSAANACLYGLCHAAIAALGYSPGLGFIHSGKLLSFVYDIADLYKTDITVPAAFEAAAAEVAAALHPSLEDRDITIEQRARALMRRRMTERRLLARIPRDIAHLLDIPLEGYLEDPWADDPSRPAQLWTPATGDQTSLPAEPPTSPSPAPSPAHPQPAAPDSP